MPLTEADELHSPLFVFSLHSRQSPFYYGPTQPLSVSVLEGIQNVKVRLQSCGIRDSFVASLWAEQTATDHLIMADFFFFLKQICCKTRQTEITHHDAASLGCTRNSGQAESQVRGLSAFILINTEFSHHKKGIWWSSLRFKHNIVGDSNWRYISLVSKEKDEWYLVEFNQIHLLKYRFDFHFLLLYISTPLHLFWWYLSHYLLYRFRLLFSVWRVTTVSGDYRMFHQIQSCKC